MKNVFGCDSSIAANTMTSSYLNLSASFVVIVSARSSNSISFPSGRNCNWNQYCGRIYTITKDVGCSFACALDMINILDNGFNDTPQNVINIWDNRMLWWKLTDYGVSVSFPNNPNTSSTAICEIIRSSIDNGHLVLLIGSHPHFIVAYGYTNQASSFNDIFVLDPYKHDDDSEIGNYTTLYEAINGIYATMGSIVGYGIATRTT